MSYSFSVRAASAAEAKTKIATEFDNVVNSQPIHAEDRAQAEAAANAFVDIMEVPAEGQVISLNIHGSLGWNSNPNPKVFTSVNLGISGSLVKAES